MSRGTAIAEREHINAEIVNDEREMVEVVETTALQAMEAAEISQQVSTAKRYPRSPERFLRQAKAMVSIDPELAESCTYYLEREEYNKETKRKEKKVITGPSVRLAEICACCWQNLFIAGRVVDDDGRMITAQGIAWDLEQNVRYVLETKRGVTYSPNAKYNPGGRFGDDMIKTTCNAAVATVSRNATFKVIPKAFVNMVWRTAQEVARGDEKTLGERTTRAVKWFNEQGVKTPKVYERLGINGPADVTLDHLMILQGFKTAVGDGETTIAEIFAVLESEPVKADAAGTKTQQVSSQLGQMFPDDKPAEAMKEKPAKKTREPGDD